MTEGKFASSHTPSLGVLGPWSDARGVAMAWKGWQDDPRVFITKITQGPWESQVELPFHTSDTPAVAWYRDRTILVWKGSGEDQRLWWSSSPSSRWSSPWNFGPQRETGFESNGRPALHRVGGVLMMLWRGRFDDEGLFSAVLNDGSWGPQHRLTEGRSMRGATLTGHGT